MGGRDGERKKERKVQRKKEREILKRNIIALYNYKYAIFINFCSHERITNRI